MAVQFKTNPVGANIARSFNGKTVSTFVITPLVQGGAAAVDFTDELGPNGAFQAILQIVTAYTTPVMISAAADITQPAYTFFIEGDFGRDNWGAANVQDFEAYLAAAIAALGATAAPRSAALAAATGETASAGVDLRGTTVTRDVVFQADQINATGVPYQNA